MSKILRLLSSIYETREGFDEETISSTQARASCTLKFSLNGLTHLLNYYLYMLHSVLLVPSDLKLCLCCEVKRASSTPLRVLYSDGRYEASVLLIRLLIIALLSTNWTLALD